MQAGLERTSGPFYGRWVTSPDWVRFALARPFVDEPGGRMLYSTGSSHLLSAILTRAAGRSTLALARSWLGEPWASPSRPGRETRKGSISAATTCCCRPRALLRFGELYRLGVDRWPSACCPRSWIAQSWTPRARSPFTGDVYGYGWFLAEAHGHPVRYAWGFGGQMLHVVPDLGLTVVMTSDTDAPSGRTGYARELHALLAEAIVPAVAAGG